MQCVARHDKSLLFPKIVYSSCEDVGGYYIEPERCEYEIDGSFVDASKGIIVVSTLWPDSIDSTITHEWRHHWQRFNWGSFPEWPWALGNDDSYEESIKQYFRAPHELDALLFEYKYARNEETNDYWYGLLAGELEA